MSQPRRLVTKKPSSDLNLSSFEEHARNGIVSRTGIVFQLDILIAATHRDREISLIDMGCQGCGRDIVTI